MSKVGRPSGDVQGVDPAIEIFFNFIDNNQSSSRQVEERAGLGQGSLTRYRNGGVSPSLASFRALLNTSGLDLAVVKVSNKNESD